MADDPATFHVTVAAGNTAKWELVDKYGHVWAKCDGFPTLEAANLGAEWVKSNAAACPVGKSVRAPKANG